MSGTVVMKFGGTSVADAERIKRAAKRIVKAREQGQQVVAVLSARGKTTDELIASAEEVSTAPDPREMDMLLSTGERISCALCAMAINDLGHRAISLTGSQAGIVTDTSHTKARILDVRADRIRQALDEDLIVLVAGFQGVSTAKDVTTLGRGGSDTTAVALAAAIGAEVCEIYTDVAGVFSADPRIVPDARKLPIVSFEEMLEMSASGAGVLQLRSVEYGRTHGVRIHCRSSFTEELGTYVVGEEETMERPLITAVTHSTDEARITLLGVPDHPGIAGKIFTALADANVNVDMIIQNEPESEGAAADMSFTVPRTDVRLARETLDPVVAEVGIARVAEDPAMGKVSVVGAGMKSHPGVAAKVFSTLGREGINIEMISTSPIKISCVVQADAGHDRGQGAARGVRAGRGRRPRGASLRAGSRDMSYRVAVVGATGAVGTVMLRQAARAGLPGARDRAVRLARARPAGSWTGFGTVQPLTDETIQGFDLAIFSAGATTSGEWAPRFVDAGCVVVDNSSRLRRDDDIPLVVSEVNPHALERHRGLIANPNCSTMQLMVVLKPILDTAGIERLIVSTYQSVSGTGVKAVEELEAQTHAVLHGVEPPAPTVYPHPIAFNVLGGAGNFKDGDDYTDEERKMMFETRKILETPDIGISVTCARVPVISVALGVGERADARPDRARRGARAAARRTRASTSSTIPRATATRRRSPARAATRCSSAGSGATRRTRAR